MATEIYYRGSDVPKIIAPLDKLGVAIDIDNLDELYVDVIGNNNKVFAKFSKAGTGDYTALIRQTAYTYKLWIDSSITSIMPIGNVYFKIELVSEQLELPDGELNAIAKKLIFELRR